MVQIIINNVLRMELSNSCVKNGDISSRNLRSRVSSSQPVVVRSCIMYNNVSLAGQTHIP